MQKKSLLRLEIFICLTWNFGSILLAPIFYFISESDYLRDINGSRTGFSILIIAIFNIFKKYIYTNYIGWVQEYKDYLHNI